MRENLITELVIKYNISDLKEMLHDEGIFKTKSSFLYGFLTDLQSDEILLSSIDEYIKKLLIHRVKRGF